MDLSPALSGLTDKQRLYVQARLEGDAPAQAARRAGVKDPSKSWKLMEAQATVKAALAQGREISIKACGITRESVTEMFQEAFRNAANATEQIAAARELGRLWGVYEANKVKVEHRVEQVRHEQELRSLTVDQLEQLTVLEGEFIELSQERAVARR